MKTLSSVLFFCIFVLCLVNAQVNDSLLLADFESEMNGWDHAAPECPATVDVLQGNDPSGNSDHSLEIQIDGSNGGKAGFARTNQKIIFGADTASGIAIYFWVDTDFIEAISGVQIFVKERETFSWEAEWYDPSAIEDGYWNRLFLDLNERYEEVEGYKDLIDHGIDSGVEMLLSDTSYEGSVYADNIYLLGISHDATAINSDFVNQPAGFQLQQNFPNPFNPVTKIRYILPQKELVTVTIYDLSGRLVETLIDREIQPAGPVSITFDGSHLSSGTYFYRVQTSKAVQVKKMLLIR